MVPRAIPAATPNRYNIGRFHAFRYFILPQEPFRLGYAWAQSRAARLQPRPTRRRFREMAPSRMKPQYCSLGTRGSGSLPSENPSRAGGSPGPAPFSAALLVASDRDGATALLAAAWRAGSAAFNRIRTCGGRPVSRKGVFTGSTRNRASEQRAYGLTVLGFGRVVALPPIDKL